MSGQLPLFAGIEEPRRGPVGPAEAPPELRALGARLPAGLRLGTSSWTFPGWEGLVYDRPAKQAELARDGLAAYARHPLLRAVGVDRTYYAPVDAETFARYAAAVPEDFRFLVKAGEALVRPQLKDRVNPTFLDPVWALDQVVGPFREGLGPKAGPLVFQFPPLDLRRLGGPGRFLDRLQRFLDALPRGPHYAVELRTQEAFTPAYLAALAELGVSHCFNGHPALAPIARQWEQARGQPGPGLVVRWMLARGERYESAREAFAPFTRLAREDPGTREQIASAAADVLGRGGEVTVVVNNKAEGCSPRSVARLAERIAALLEAR